ncbi:MAG: hypothetical protein ABSG01_12780 [Anaerolineales bacterium]
MTTPDYRTQNIGDCPGCSFRPTGEDAKTKHLSVTFFTLANLASKIADSNLTIMVKLVNDTGKVHLDGLDPDPGGTVQRTVVKRLATLRAGDIVGHRAAQALAGTITP